VFLVIGSEPSFDLALGCGFADSSEDMFDPLLLAVRVEVGFAFSYAPELASMIRQNLPRLAIFTDSLVEEGDHVLCCSFFEYLGGCDVAAVVVKDGDEPSRAHDLEVALP